MRFLGFVDLLAGLRCHLLAVGPPESTVRTVELAMEEA
jgi:hypothetical protein